MSMSDYTEGQIRADWFRTTARTRPTILGIALFTAAPSDSGGGTEVSGGSYARVNLPPLDANWTAPDTTGGLTANTAAVTFPTATANWGVITHVGIYDATSGGNLLWWGALSASKTVNSGDTFSFAASALSITFS